LYMKMKHPAVVPHQLTNLIHHLDVKEKKK